ncbi:MAG: hypothetical protein BWK80_62730 [Desulfobacteraceae bacterium IS3]|nr:MAG: hypothetical protein BWK80_62730 [Desulfobacteraceae bacterium IS3]HAO23483.1 hypothetical protein [Desulfobacteraceae bacterium]
MNFMLDTLPGLIVERAIPSDVWGGLMMGRYKLHGGVVRLAAGKHQFVRLCFGMSFVTTLGKTTHSV